MGVVREVNSAHEGTGLMQVFRQSHVNSSASCKIVNSKRLLLMQTNIFNR
jgi:hypothetical protein